VGRGISLDRLPQAATNPKGKYSAAVALYPKAIEEKLSMRTTSDDGDFVHCCAGEGSGGFDFDGEPEAQRIEERSDRCEPRVASCGQGAVQRLAV